MLLSDSRASLKMISLHLSKGIIHPSIFPGSTQKLSKVSKPKLGFAYVYVYKLLGEKVPIILSEMMEFDGDLPWYAVKDHLENKCK